MVCRSFKIVRSILRAYLMVRFLYWTSPARWRASVSTSTTSELHIYNDCLSVQDWEYCPAISMRLYRSLVQISITNANLSIRICCSWHSYISAINASHTIRLYDLNWSLTLSSRKYWHVGIGPKVWVLQQSNTKVQALGVQAMSSTAILAIYFIHQFLHAKPGNSIILFQLALTFMPSTSTRNAAYTKMIERGIASWLATWSFISLLYGSSWSHLLNVQPQHLNFWKRNHMRSCFLCELQSRSMCRRSPLNGRSSNS